MNRPRSATSRLGARRIAALLVVASTVGFVAPVASLPASATESSTPDFPAPDCPAQFGDNGAKLTPSLLSDATHTVKRYSLGDDTRGGEVNCNYYDTVTNYNYGWTVYYLFATTSAADVAQALRDGFGPLGGWDNPDPLECAVSTTTYAFLDCSPLGDAATREGGLAMLAAVEPLAAPQVSVAPTTSTTEAPTSTETPTTDTPTTETPTVATPPKLPLCPEATAAFSPEKLQTALITDAAATGMHIDGQGLLDTFQQQIATFNAAHPDGNAYVTNNIPGGTVGAAAWLFSNGGIAAETLNSLYVTGHESSLNSQIFALSKVRLAANGPPISPADVFGMALDLEGGNVTQALLTAHNTVRALVRGDAAGVGVPGPASDFINRSFERIRDGEIGGPWYHLFGTAYLETVAKGDWGQRLVGAYADASAYLDGAGGDPYEQLADQYSRQLPTASSLSSLANAVEQIYRENVRNDKGELNRPDPEKYCFNVWGAQLGSALYKSLPLFTTSKVQGMFSSFTESVDSLLDLPEQMAREHLLNIMGSPYSVQWSDGARTTVLDQGGDGSQASLTGNLPIFVLPVREEGSWGAAWLSSGDSAESVTFEAMRDGAPLHYARTNLDTGTTAYYETTAAHAGDRYTVSLDATAVAPVMTGPSGADVKPQLLSDAVSTKPSSSSAGLWMAVGTATLIVLCGGCVFVRRRRRYQRRSKIDPPAPGDSGDRRNTALLNQQ